MALQSHAKLFQMENTKKDSYVKPRELCLLRSVLRATPNPDPPMKGLPNHSMSETVPIAFDDIFDRNHRRKLQIFCFTVTPRSVCPSQMVYRGPELMPAKKGIRESPDGGGLSRQSCSQMASEKWPITHLFLWKAAHTESWILMDI
jgi:hypothetical protein